MPAYPVKFVDGAFHVGVAPGEWLPLRQGGQAVRAFNPGWSAAHVWSGVANTRCLLLRHHNGSEAVWYLDSAMQFQTNDLARLPPHQMDEMTRVAHSDMARLWDELLCRPAPDPDPLALALDPLTRAAITRDTPIPGNGEVSVVLEPAGAGTLDLGGPARSIGFARARETLGADYVALAAAALDSGRIEIASPFSGDTLATDSALPLRFGVYAYRFYDPAADFVFYAVAAAWRTQFLALYVPARDVTLYARPLDRQWLSEWLGQSLRTAFAGHLAQYAEPLRDYLAAPARRFALIYHQEHLGHHLWNELTGLEAVLDRIGPAHIPPVFMLEAGASEMWGRLDVLFPQLRGHVDRSLRNGAQLTARAYQDRLTLLRPGSNYVSRALAARIIEVSEPEATGAPEQYRQLRQDGFRIVMLGLRVENRTLVDLRAFCRDLIAFMHARAPRLAVVIDGHNAALDAAPGTIYRSHGEPRAKLPPAQAERDILADLRAEFGAMPGIRIIDTIGAPIGASLFWCNRAEFFVTPWGAGLAKYRWICNRPGVVTAGPTFLRRSGEDTIHLYDSAKFMEQPTELLFTGPEDAEDAPDAPMLVGLPTPDRQNYRLDFDAAFALVAGLLARG